MSASLIPWTTCGSIWGLPHGKTDRGRRVYPPSRDFAHVARSERSRQFPRTAPRAPARRSDGGTGERAGGDRGRPRLCRPRSRRRVGDHPCSWRTERKRGATRCYFGGGRNSRRPNIASDSRDVFSKVGQFYACNGATSLKSKVYLEGLSVTNCQWQLTVVVRIFVLDSWSISER